ncbi:hypothetical protein [Actinophytocola oryzae]|uniref:Uncharacterized protein n=1 Tax=Actinophytocola oryzae TaxID=502181 RepID=A0A4R7W5C1_9PSEU|nr:hypothetical protein [Actinophytocola oryzae]TDV57435.1 hypothetical protein CLV71_101306 [Actinophytocola oryzae]
MPDDRIDKLEKSLAYLRKRLDEVERGQRHDRGALGYALTACTVAGALGVLTATTWRSASDSDGHLDQATTLWGMVPEGWQAVVTLALVLLTAGGSLAAFTGESGRATHIFFVVAALVTIIAIVFLVGQVEPDGFYDPEDTDVGTGRWLSGLACLVLAVVHGAKAGERPPRR